MTEFIISEKQHCCVACKEFIHQDALICPICGFHQKTSVWQRLLLLAKWIGGSAALISLILGVHQLNGIVKLGNERRIAVNQVIASCNLLLEMRDYQAAWKIARQAAQISPESNKALKNQVDIAMAWLRDIWFQKKDRTYCDIIDPLILVLSKGSANSDRKRVARVLAHIGWANYLRLEDRKSKYEVTPYLEKAIEFNPDDVYANTFTGVWLLNKPKNSGDEYNLLQRSKACFNKALNTGEDTGFVNKWYISALTMSNVPGAEFEAFKVANQWRKQNRIPLIEAEKESVLRKISQLFSYQKCFNLPEDGIHMMGVRELTFVDLRDTYIWIIEELKPNRKAGLNYLDIDHLGLFAEACGKLELAYRYYVEYLNQGIKYNIGLVHLVRECLSRIIKKSIVEANISLPGVQPPGTFENSIIIDESGKLGIKIADVGLRTDISKIFPGPAQNSGLKVGDILFQITDLLHSRRYDEAPSKGALL